MKIEHYYPLLTLSGLILDIVGAFFLSIEAIGIEKIIRWKQQLLTTPNKLDEIIESKKIKSIIDPEDLLHFPINVVRLIFSMFIFLAIVMGLCIDIRFFISDFFLILVVLGIFVYSRLIFILAHLLSFVLKKSSRLLQWTELNFKKGQIGVLGFLFLFIGFLFQFFGTFFQFISALNN
jgi:hypothetical protein